MIGAEVDPSSKVTSQIPGVADNGLRGCFGAPLLGVRRRPLVLQLKPTWPGLRAATVTTPPASVPFSSPFSLLDGVAIHDFSNGEEEE